MGKWLKKFSERAQVSTDSVDALHTTSTCQCRIRCILKVFRFRLLTHAIPPGHVPSADQGSGGNLPGEPWRCCACEPGMPRTTATLTFPCHKVELRPVAGHAGLRTLFENACRGLRYYA